eukprot:IDg13397t1
MLQHPTTGFGSVLEVVPNSLVNAQSGVTLRTAVPSLASSETASLPTVLYVGSTPHFARSEASARTKTAQSAITSSKPLGVSGEISLNELKRIKPSAARSATESGSLALPSRVHPACEGNIVPPDGVSTSSSALHVPIPLALSPGLPSQPLLPGYIPTLFPIQATHGSGATAAMEPPIMPIRRER